MQMKLNYLIHSVQDIKLIENKTKQNNNKKNNEKKSVYFDLIQLIHYKCHRVSFRSGSSYIDFQPG